MVVTSSLPELAKDANINESESWTSMNSVGCCNKNICILKHQKKNPIESKKLSWPKSNSKICSNLNIYSSNDNRSQSSEELLGSPDYSHDSTETLSIDSKQAWFQKYENLEEKDDVWEIINLLSIPYIVIICFVCFL
ncbi:hypothetical protein QE152_g7381 [Popillia japonica]|uniref:Uncharacterized protein n=1 Tax=Popillia japonica TaxID=7064 RepID=A0AAW1MFN2_POPJA